MTALEARQLHSTPRRYEIPDLLQTIFIAELLSPSRCIWLVSPWISDIPVVDNRSDAFSTVEPAWSEQNVRLSAVLAWLCNRGTTIHVATRNVDHNHAFLESLRARSPSAKTHIHIADQLHEKGLLGDGYYLSGSMNFTHGGISTYEEMVHYFVAPSVVGQNRIAFTHRWGGE